MMLLSGGRALTDIAVTRPGRLSDRGSPDDGGLNLSSRGRIIFSALVCTSTGSHDEEHKHRDDHHNDGGVDQV